MTWFYESNGEQKGPVSEAELDRLISQGTILPTTLVWRDGLANWTPLGQARPTASAGSAAPGLGTMQCDSCGRFFEDGDVVQIGGRNICAACKPVVLQSLQQGTGYAGVAEQGRGGPAWEQREALGFVSAARDTITAVLLRPTETFSSMRVSGGLANPFWFNLIFAGCGNVILFVALFALQLLMGANSAFSQAPLAPGASVVVLGFQLIWAFVAVAIGCFIQAAFLHVSLMLCGGARRTYEATFRVVCYTLGSLGVLNIVPIVGAVVAVPWYLVVMCIGLARAHEIDLWRAVLAMFLPLIICCALGVVMAVVVGGLAGLAPHH